MTKPISVFIGGRELLGYTELSLTRRKKDLTGSLDVTVFYSHVPDAPVIPDVVRGSEVVVYVGGNIAFWGILDKRSGTSLDLNTYTVKLSARGRTKVLVDSSHLVKENFINKTDRDVVERMLQDFDVDLDWMGQAVQLDKMRLRDGALVLDELVRIASENAHFIYETRDGKLRVTDDVGPGSGDPLVLGQNILTFNATQTEEPSRSNITVKGQRTKNEIWGEDAILERVKEVTDEWAVTNSPIVVQHYGDATDEALERRAKFEANKRSAAAKNVKVDVFHVQSTSGQPWDIGTLHYVEIPPEGIYDVFECVGLTYSVNAKDTLKTTLELSPPPSAGGSIGTGTLLSETSNLVGRMAALAPVGAGRRAAATSGSGSYPAPWTGPVLRVLDLASAVATAYQSATSLLGSGKLRATPPPLSITQFPTEDTDDDV